jgi:FkbM family methyltransferase
MLRYRTSELSLDLDMVLSHYRIEHPDVSYLQVGAFDGIAGDPIYHLIERHALRGILVEPQKDAFERLKANYARFPDFRFVNAAIANRDGASILYRIKPEARGPEWLHQIASFDREVLMRHAQKVPGLESMIEMETVRSLTFSTLFKEIGIDRVDMLQIDAEGLDAEILKQFDVGLRKPAIVRFEHKHLRLADHEIAIGSLVDHGYKVTSFSTDTLAYCATAKPVLSR